MGSTRCRKPGCGRDSAKSEPFCRKHRSDSNGVLTEPCAVSPDLNSEESHLSTEEFQRRLASGDYRALFGELMNGVILQAAEEPGLSDEIGILRVVLARILIEERDPAQLAESIARVVGVAVQAARAQRAIGEEKAERIEAEVVEALKELSLGANKEVAT